MATAGSRDADKSCYPMQASRYNHYQLINPNNGMIIHVPTKTAFNNRREAKEFFGAAYFCKMLKEGKDILFINDAHIAFNGTIYSTNKGNNGDRR
jgi:predicted glycosyltransferase involved in capsule biosynthesis